MRVVKLGGSLNRDPLLRDWLQLLADAGGGRVVIVPGGGDFAEQVRELQSLWRFDDLTAHNMAILGMMQSAMLMQSLAANLEQATTAADIGRVLGEGKVALWSPAQWIRTQADAMTNWGATSDSLAAWLATTLGATGLVLVKSCDVRPGIDLAELTRQGALDTGFCRVAADASYSIDVLGKDELSRMRLLLTQGC